MNAITYIGIAVILLTFVVGVAYALYMNIRYKKEQDARIRFYNSASNRLNRR